MNTGRLITKNRDAVTTTVRRALTVDNPPAEPVHLLHGFLPVPDNTVGHLLTAVDTDPATVDARATEDISKRSSSTDSSVTQPTISGALARILTMAEALTEQLGNQFVTTKRLLTDLASVGSQVRTISICVGITAEKLIKAFEGARGGKRVTSTESEGGESALDGYSTDLTKRAHSGKPDPVIGCNQEARRAIQALVCRTENSPVLIGEPGIGKTAVVEGLAMRLVGGNVPDPLKGCRLVSLDLTSMVAGAKYWGDFEERLEVVLNEIKELEGRIITFADELHIVIGVGSIDDDGMDMDNMLKLMFACGELRVIGATTPDEYRERIEKDPALEHRFQQVYVDKLFVEDAIAILHRLQKHHETHHKVRITDSALVAAATLSDHYVTSRKLPDKTADLVDEVASRLWIEIDSSLEEIGTLRCNVDRMLMQELHLKNEEDTASHERSAALRSEPADAQEKLRDLETHQEQEKPGLNRIGDLKERVDTLRVEADRAQRAGDLGRAPQLLYGEIPIIEQQLIDAKKTDTSASRMVSNEVSGTDIAEIIAA